MQARSFLLQGAPLRRTKCSKTHVGNGDAFLMAQDDIYAFHPARWLQPWQAPSLARPFNAVNQLAAGYSSFSLLFCSQWNAAQFFFSLLFLLAQLMHRDLNSSLSDGQRHITECLLTCYRKISRDRKTSREFETYVYDCAFVINNASHLLLGRT